MTTTTSPLGEISKAELFWKFSKPSWTHCLWSCDKNLYLKSAAVVTIAEYVALLIPVLTKSD